MKYIVWAIAIILCFVFGRIMYSPLGPALLAQGSSASEGSERPTVIFGTGSNELRITINLKTVGEREMPTSVLLKKKTPVAAADGSSQTMLAKGDSVTVVERKGLHLVITAGGPLTGLVEIEDTDFTERVIEY
ncbi:MAG: hypothetical protein ACKJSK_21165, partial [Roseibacillus sp.]